MPEIKELNRDGVTLEWLHDGRIAMFHAENTSSETIDAWYHMSVELVQNWPQAKPYLVLSNFSNLGLTPYSRQRSEELAAAIPDSLNGRVAVVISRGILGYGLRMFGTTPLKALVPNLEFEFFFEETKALAWLEEAL